MTAIGAMPDELSKVIHDFIRPTEAYEVILYKLGVWVENEECKKVFRTMEEADRCFADWEVPDDGNDYEVQLNKTFPAFEDICCRQFEVCEVCSVLTEVECEDDLVYCRDCDKRVCRECRGEAAFRYGIHDCCDECTELWTEEEDDEENQGSEDED